MRLLRCPFASLRASARNDTPSVIARSGNDEAISSDCHALAPSLRSGFQLTAMTGKKRLATALRLSTHSIGRGLAVGAEVSASVPQGNALNGSTANRAVHAFPVSDVEIKMRCAQLTARADISVRAGSFLRDS